jgi:predicted AAA+ superfamily ATPase
MNSKTIYTDKNFEHIEIRDGGVANFGDIHKIHPQLSSKLAKSTIIGRKKELKEIDSLLKTNNSLLLINGIGGVGKSTIASYYLYSQKENYNYYGFFEGLEGFITELKPRLNLKSEKPDELFLEAIKELSILEGKKLLVLDDIKDSEENQKYIDRILELKHNCQVSPRYSSFLIA